MVETRPAEHWNRRYLDGDLPWDARRPEPRLTELVEQLEPPTRLALDIGCGTGDNAHWLCRAGFDAIGIDIAAEAVAIAERRAIEAGLANCRFVCHSVLDPLPVEPASVGVSLDRGCFHSIADADRAVYARHLAAALAPGGWWLAMCGNRDEDRREGEEGPPQMTAAQIASAIEPFFVIHRIERCAFTRGDGQPGHLTWRCVSQCR